MSRAYALRHGRGSSLARRGALKFFDDEFFSEYRAGGKPLAAPADPAG